MSLVKSLTNINDPITLFKTSVDCSKIIVFSYFATFFIRFLFYKSQPLCSLIISGYLYFLKANYAIRVTYLVCFNKKESFSKNFYPRMTNWTVIHSRSSEFFYLKKFLIFPYRYWLKSIKSRSKCQRKSENWVGTKSSVYCPILMTWPVIIKQFP